MKQGGVTTAEEKLVKLYQTAVAQVKAKIIVKCIVLFGNGVLKQLVCVCKLK